MSAPHRTALVGLACALVLGIWLVGGDRPGDSPAREPTAAEGAADVSGPITPAAGTAAAATGTGEAATATASAEVLRVCADPNNLPFSNDREEGFENRLAELVAGELGRAVRYTWWAQRRGFLRNTLNAEACDVVMGVPGSMELLLTTRPYYRSTYVFVWRTDRRYDIRSFDDPALRELRVGVQLVGDDFSNAPPAHALAGRGIVSNVRGYSVYGDYTRPSPPAEIVEAVARDEIDVAVVWGPLAGYFAPRQPVPLTLVPVSPQIDLPFLPMVFDISMGVRRGEEGLLTAIEGILVRRKVEIDRLLAEYGVPRLDGAGAAATIGGRPATGAPPATGAAGAAPPPAALAGAGS